MFEIKRSSTFKKDWKKCKFRKNFDEGLFYQVVSVLARGQKLNIKYRDHFLTGEMQNFRECHLKPDLLLVYEIKDRKIKLLRMGTHSELFG